MFNIGKSNTHQEKKKKPEEIAAERVKQTFNMARENEAEDLKRKREDYAVQLRKKQKEEMFRAKRTTLSDAKPQGATADPTQQVPQVAAQQMQQPTIATQRIGDQAMGGSTGPQDDALIDVPIEHVLQAAETMPLSEFIVQVQRINFKVIFMSLTNTSFYSKPISRSSTT